MIRKSEFPEKICPVCQKPFKWRNCWEEVVYCSQRCRQNKKPKK